MNGMCAIENIVTICFNQAIDEFYDEWGKQNKKSKLFMFKMISGTHRI